MRVALTVLLVELVGALLVWLSYGWGAPARAALICSGACAGLLVDGWVQLRRAEAADDARCWQLVRERWGDE